MRPQSQTLTEAAAETESLYPHHNKQPPRAAIYYGMKEEGFERVQ